MNLTLPGAPQSFLFLGTLKGFHFNSPHSQSSKTDSLRLIKDNIDENLREDL